jgi:hypothetical protein
MTEVYQFKEPTLKHKFNQFAYDTKNNTRKGVNWVVENPEKAVGLVTLSGMVVGAGVKGYKTISKAVSEHNAAREMYCGTVNRKVRLRRQLTDRDIKELAALMSDGLTRYEALSQMNLIK